jgi:hypothetical protein
VVAAGKFSSHAGVSAGPAHAHSLNGGLVSLGTGSADLLAVESTDRLVIIEVKLA